MSRVLAPGSLKAQAVIAELIPALPPDSSRGKGPEKGSTSSAMKALRPQKGRGPQHRPHRLNHSLSKARWDGFHSGNPCVPLVPLPHRMEGLGCTRTRIGADLGSAPQGLLLGTGLQITSISFCLQYLNTGNINQAFANPQKELSNMKILKSKSF